MINKHQHFANSKELLTAIQRGELCLSYSGAKRLLESVSSFVEYYTDSEENKTSKALEFGKLFHLFLLEPDKFNSNVIILPDDAGNVGTQKRVKLETEIKAQKITKGLSADTEFLFINGLDLKTLETMRNSLQGSHSPHIKQIFDYSQHHREKVYISPRGELSPTLATKAVIDFHSEMGIYDLKTTSSTIEYNNSTVSKFKYHLQAYLYQTILRLQTGEKLPFYHIVVDASGEYKIVQFGDYWISQGETLFKKIEDKLSDIILNGESFEQIIAKDRDTVVELNPYY